MAQTDDKKQGRRSLREVLKSRLGRYLVLFVVSAWMFVLGVLVGRGTAPVRFDLGSLDAELAELKANEQQQQMARVKIDAKAVDPKTDLEFYEELKKTQKPPVPKDRQPAEKPKPEPDKPPPKVVKKTTQQPAAPKVSSDEGNRKKSPAAGSNAAKKTPAAQPEDESGGLTIQAASLREPQDADDLVDRLKKKGYPAYKTIAVVPQQGIWFRVRVGRFGSREDAADTLRQLKKDGFDPFLVNRTD